MYDKIQKINVIFCHFFFLQSIIPAHRDDLVELLFERQEEMSKWNPTVNDCRVCNRLKKPSFKNFFF